MKPFVEFLANYQNDGNLVVGGISRVQAKAIMDSKALSRMDPGAPCKDYILWPMPCPCRIHVLWAWSSMEGLQEGFRNPTKGILEILLGIAALLLESRRRGGSRDQA